MSRNKILSRRSFGNLLATAGLTLASLPVFARERASSRKKLPMATTASVSAPLLKPPRLEPGDLVGLIAPGGHTNAAAVARAVRNIESLGLRVKLGRNLNAIYGNYGGTVRQRIDDLHEMFLDPQVNAVWAIRGGSGCMALLPHIDYALVRANPKVLIGYSDITALHLALQRHAGLMTFHGPVASSTFSDYTVTQLRNVLMTPHDRYVIAMAQENAERAVTDPQYAVRTVHGGQATGRLMGGNLCLVAALAGTPYAADFRDGLLFLEDVNEAPYRIDRMFMQLQLSHGLQHAAGVMLGVFEHCGPTDDEPSLTLDETVDQHLLPLTVPAVAGYSFGHIRDQFTLPMGALATLDTAQQTLTLLEAGVS